MSRRGQIAIDKIVAVRSSVLPLYILIQPDGSVTASDEVSEDGNDFLTTFIRGDQISFKTIRGDYLSTEGGQVGTRRYCSDDERFKLEKLDMQYAFRARSGKYLSMTDRAPFVVLADTAGETETFQLFSLMMANVNVGQQLEYLERTGTVMIDGLLDEEQVAALRNAVAERGGGERGAGHESRVCGLAACSAGFAELTTHPIVMQLARRMLSPALKLSDVESCRTDADFVRKELEATTWHVVHPYSDVEFPGVVDARISFTATWFLDTLDGANSTWAYVKVPLTDGAHLPQLPQLSSPEQVQAVIKGAKPLTGVCGSVMLYMGPVWTSNNIGAASFWKDYDAQTRYKHLSGQKDQSFRALTNAQFTAQPKEEMCPTIVQATYVREYVVPRSPPPSVVDLGRLTESERQPLEQILPP